MKLSNYFIVNTSIFLAGVLFLILSPFSIILNILALLLLGAGFLMLAYSQTNVYKNFKKQVDTTRQELILELATEDDGEAYVYNKNKTLKRQNKQINQFFKDRKLTIIFLYILGAAFIYFAVKIIIGLI